MSIRDWPEGERPREKLLERGSGALSDAELLAVLLGSGVRGKDAIALGRELLTQAGSLGALLSRPDQPIRVAGLGPAKRARIAAALELARRSLAEQLHERPSLESCWSILMVSTWDLPMMKLSWLFFPHSFRQTLSTPSSYIILWAGSWNTLPGF